MEGGERTTGRRDRRRGCRLRFQLILLTDESSRADPHLSADHARMDLKKTMPAACMCMEEEAPAELLRRTDGVLELQCMMRIRSSLPSVASAVHADRLLRSL